MCKTSALSACSPNPPQSVYKNYHVFSLFISSHVCVWTFICFNEFLCFYCFMHIIISQLIIQPHFYCRSFHIAALILISFFWFHKGLGCYTLTCHMWEMRTHKPNLYTTSYSCCTFTGMNTDPQASLCLTLWLYHQQRGVKFRLSLVKITTCA